ncbi:substrate-binding periplasmic protein [Thalassotalea fusca]
MKNRYCVVGLFFLFLTIRHVSAEKVLFEHYLPVQIYSEIWPPFQVRNEQGQLTGPATDQVKAAFDEAKIAYDIQPMRWARALNLIRLKPNALIYSISRTPDREKHFYWIARLGRVNTKLLGLSENNDIISHPSELINYVIALKRAEASLDYFLDLGLIPDKNIIFVNDTEQALRLLDIGRVDFYPISAAGLKPSLESTGYPSSKFKYVYYFEELSFDFYIAANKESDRGFIEYISNVFRKCVQCPTSIEPYN